MHDEYMSELKCVSAYDENGTRRPRTEIKIKNLAVGRDFLTIAGPCSVESEEQIFAAAETVKAAGANMLRGGAFKPRTSPYTFRGLGRTALEYLYRAGKASDLPVITEVMDTRDVELVAEYADVLQIGSRNMQNYSLLVEVGRVNKPVLLKRSMHATIEEWLSCAEYILSQGNPNVILCERGIRSFETYARNTLDLSVVPAVKELSHLPVIVDPSHATGRREMIRPMSLAAVMAGCDGLEIEVHPNPETALSDAEQQLSPAEFSDIMEDVRDTLQLRARINKRTSY